MKRLTEKRTEDFQRATSGTESLTTKWRRVIGRRSFLHGVGIAGATLAATTLAAESRKKLSSGDAAILRFLAAAELIESDLWLQYAELGGVNGGNPAYMLALQNLDGDMPQYITDNTEDEISHAAFLNAYLMSRGAKPVNLDQFKTLKSPQHVTGANPNTPRLTNLTHLDLDTSFYTRYRSNSNPDLGTNFENMQAVSIKNQPAIPIDDTDTPPGMAQPVPPTTTQQRRMQAIANSAAFHFAFIEQGGSSLYPTMALKVTDLEVLRIVLSIGGVEIDHFGLWHDKLGNAVSQPLAGVVDPETGTKFPDLNNPANQPFGNDLAQTNLILPEPCQFIGNLPNCSIIRPISTHNSGAVAAVNGLTADKLFVGHVDGFMEELMDLATAADAAQREIG